jgi:hypothetical protein
MIHLTATSLKFIKGQNGDYKLGTDLLHTNRKYSFMIKRLSLSIFFLFNLLIVFGQKTKIEYLSGTDKDHTVLWDFYCTGGRLSGKWTKIPVPSNWELQGFGSYNYGHDKNKADEQGLYKHEFTAGKWQDKKVFIVFEGSMTDTHVKINGIDAGPVHQGGFYRFKYDITNYIKQDSKNLLEVRVDKMSANLSVNQAERKSDFWVFGGIFRPVYLEILPETNIDRTAINARADGSLQIDVFKEKLKAGQRVEAQVKTLSGKNLGKPFSVSDRNNKGYYKLSAQFDKPLLWNAEFPNLYQVAVSIKEKNSTVHQVTQKFGFRTVELRKNDGLYVNGAKVVLKGTNRHSFWPETGRTLSYQLNLADVKLMKEMNNNAVRMSHYPPDQNFLDICDSLGLYVLDELTGWQAKYDTQVGRKLVKELVVRDVNHPSIIFWDNGNEGGWNTDLDNDYRLYDPQDRQVLHPWEKFNGTDTHHYPDYNAILKAVKDGKEVFFPTEFMHGLYDGGAGAGLQDFWEQMVKHPHGAGGFIWSFVDEAVIRTDKGNTYDGDGNHAPDGILGPHREKEASFYTIKEIWSPIYLDTSSVVNVFSGKVNIENRYSFTKLSECSFEWQLIQFPGPESKNISPTAKEKGHPKALELLPGQRGVLDLGLPLDWRKNDALYLTAYGPDHRELFTWSWAINPKTDLKRIYGNMSSEEKVNTNDNSEQLLVTCGDISYHFDKKTGYLKEVQKGNNVISLSGGPVLAGVETDLSAFKFYKEDNKIIVEAAYQGIGKLNVKWTIAPNAPARLDYTYVQSGDSDYTGITFNYPEEKMTAVKWLGRGPYRVWKNRLKGQKYSVWNKNYNDTFTGETWNYPEFKGYHQEVKWVVFNNKESSFTVFTDQENMFLQLFHPAKSASGLKNNNVEPPFPKGDIGFLNSISPIGTKFHSAASMGPQGQKNKNTGNPVSATLWFKF